MILTTEVAVLEWVRVRMLAFGSAVLCLRRKFQGAKPEENQLKHWARQTPPPFNTFVFCPFLSKVLLRHLLSSSLLPTLITLNTAVLTCAQVARWHGALEITSALKLVYKEQLVSCFKLGASRLDKIWTETAFWNPRKNSALVADRNTYNAVLSSFSCSGQWRHSATLTNDMIASFYLPDDISCDAAFGACKQASQASAALSFLERIQQVGASVLFLQEQNNCKSLLESVDFIRLPDGYSLFTSFHIFSHFFTSFTVSV